MRRPLRSIVLLALGVASCTSSATTTTVVPVTGLLVDPQAFLGAVTCSEGPGHPDQMHAFVATLVDMSGFEQSYLAAGKTWKDGGGFDELSLPSSAPAPCFVPVVFESVVVGRQYRAEIDGYDRDAGTLEPLSPGSRIMIDPKSKAYVAPRWTTSCGSHWAAPRDGGASAKSTDAATPADASTDARAPEPAHVTEQRPDGAVMFGDCRGNRLLDSGADGEPAPRPWLGGPVCASFETTIPVRGCDPLRDHGATAK